MRAKTKIMRGPGLKKILWLAAFCFLLGAGLAHAQKPGSHYLGDADGNGQIEIPDLSTLVTVLGDPAADDTLNYQSHPQSRFRQELDGNGLIEVPDYSILLNWVTGNFSNRPGNPDQLALDGTVFSLIPGDSVTVGAYALSPASQGAALRTGLGVIFKIDPSGTCTSAQIKGYDVAGGLTVNVWRDNAAYHYTLKPGAPDNGRASVRVNANGCSENQTIKIEAYIPDDTEAGVVPGRFPDKLAAGQLITVTVADVTAPDTFITSYPPDPTNSTNAAFEFNCSEFICTYECKLNSGDWENCSSPQYYSGVESWTSTSLTGAPQARYLHSAVWTGAEMIVWGGYGSSPTYKNNGGRYNPTTNSWTATTTTNAPSARQGHSAVWTGAEMIIWGGNSGSPLNTGAKYYPATNSWTAVTLADAPFARDSHRTVWTGSEMIVWGGYPDTNTGGRYDPASNTWVATSATNAPSARNGHGAVWTGTEMIVWGGSPVTNTGGRYDPSTDSWQATTVSGAPEARYLFSTDWTGTEMIVWGGDNGLSSLNTGGRYDPSSDSWTATSTTNAPVERDYHSAVWTGRFMIVWGGWSGSALNTGAKYNPTADSWTATITAGAPSARSFHTAVWTGKEMIVWGGSPNTNTGGRYMPGADNLSEGEHSFEVRAYDLAMNVDPTPATYAWTIDLTAPNTTIDSFPFNPSNSPAPSFSFSCNETNCTFECKMDSGSWGACASPKNYSGLSDASHTFQVRATDAAGNLDQTPASYYWNIDTIAPETLINSHPPDPTDSSDATFNFSCNETGCAFECNLDSLGWEPCDSPISYSSLLEMIHSFEVRATDMAGNIDQTPASFTWTIDQSPPETNITSNPPDPSSNNFADFEFSCSEPPCTFECDLDSGGWGACASPKHYTGLSNAAHSFQVRAADQLNHVDPSPASYTWTVNANPPDTSISSQPPDPSTSSDAAFEFNCSSGPCTFECQLNSQGWSSCSSPKNYVSLINGPHTFQVRALDGLGNMDLTPASYSWLIEKPLPDTFITSQPPDPVNSTYAAFEFNCSEATCTYECKLDVGGWGSCASPKSYAGAERWMATSVYDAPSARNFGLAVWTGNEMVVWGGQTGSSIYTNTGGKYNPATDCWTATTTTNAPSARSYHTAIWTGTEMIVWGGYNGSYLNTGGRYNPSTNSWTATTTTNAPSVRVSHTVIWTGTEMIVWGGIINSTMLNTGASYNPSTNYWTATTTTNAPTARTWHTAVWTGTEMIVWGGGSGTSGGRYNPSNDSWTATSTTNAPVWRNKHAAVWTGTVMIIWGGWPSSANNNGGRYNPSTDNWQATTTTGAPSGRYWDTGNKAVWTGTEMIIWGGNNNPLTNDGGKYNPLTDTWTATTTTNAPVGRSYLDVVWTGTKMIVWGGYNSGYLNTGGQYTPGYGTLNEGDHTFEVRAYDPALNVDPTPANYTWTIDLTSPNTFVSLFPTNPSNSSDASFEFFCNESNCTFKCKMDSGAWEACASPKNYTGLSDASHTFQVRAIDAAGNPDQTPVSYTWTIDTIAPETYIDTHPADPTQFSDATFTFHANQTGCVFECNLDSTGWEPCASPVIYTSLLELTHTFEVRATDPAGNTDQTPASFTWTIDQTPPQTTINSSPPDPDTHNFADFTFSCNEALCTFECNLDSEGWQSCVSPAHYVALTNGAHDFAVRATDAVGNVDLSPATYAWTVIADPPDTYITANPPDPSISYNATFEFTCSPGPCTYECSLDSQGWETCASPKSYEALADAEHNFRVRAIDAQNNMDTTPASYTWTVNANPPDTIITSQPSDPSDSTEAVFEFECTDPPCTFECNLDSQGFSSCSSPKTYSDLAEAGHTFQVRARDLDGNYDTTPASYAWSIILDYWVPTAGNVPEPRYTHSTVWTGTEMIVWGGDLTNGNLTNTGGRYNPATDTWVSTSTINAPSERSFHTAVWTGTEMIVWGGFSNISPNYPNTGGRYNPSTDSWTATTITNAPEGRQDHSVVWTGTEMIVWGGFSFINGYTNTGGNYDPATDSWTATTTTNAPSARSYHSAVWTGTVMIVWGGYTSGEYPFYTNTGARYNPATDSWVETTTIDAPAERAFHAVVWTGDEMIVWGGGNAYVEPYYYNTGGKYNPATDSWTATATDNAPSERAYVTGVWTGTEMIVWGGWYNDGMNYYYNTGGRYDPAIDSWTETSTANAPTGRENHTAVWTGNEMIVWGGDIDIYSPLNSGGRYDPLTDSWAATSTTTTNLSARWDHSAVWTGNEMIVWGGRDANYYYNTGARYDPVTDAWTPTSLINAPAGRLKHTAIWTGTEMIVWGGIGSSIFNTGARYNPSTDSWAATTTTNAPAARVDHVAVWTGTEMIVWGGYYWDGTYHYQNTGGRYAPSTDSWAATSTGTNCPSPRYTVAVWTGTEMIVWGGYYYDGTTDYFYNTGGRYDPSLDSWTETSTGTNVPTQRDGHTAVWSGTEMIIWGGSSYDGTWHWVNTGGKYNPATDSWTATSTGANVPSARAGHIAVWAGTKMVVWGGTFYDGTRYYYNTGGRYDLSTDSWLPTTTINVPTARDDDSAVWTGTEMIIWGGGQCIGEICTWTYFDTGGRYVP